MGGGVSEVPRQYQLHAEGAIAPPCRLLNDRCARPKAEKAAARQNCRTKRSSARLRS